MNMTRRQHYVWRRYLRPWAPNEKIWCERNGKVFNTNLMNVAQETDFYEIPVLNAAEYNLLNALTHIKAREGIQDIVDDYMAVFKKPTEISWQTDLSEMERQRLCREATIMGHEKLNTMFEDKSIDVLDHILNYDASFLNDDVNRFKAIFFLNYQNLRTKKRKGQFEDAKLPPMHPAFKGADMTKLAGAMSVFLALQASVGLHGWPERYGFVILKNETDVNFITSDQPVLNTEPVIEGKPKMRLYCPVGPRAAVMLSMGIIDTGIQIVNNPIEIKDWNARIILESHEQKFGCSESDLR